MINPPRRIHSTAFFGANSQVKIQGSFNGTNWTDLTANVDVASTTTQTIPLLAASQNNYSYYSEPFSLFKHFYSKCAGRIYGTTS